MARSLGAMIFLCCVDERGRPHMVKKEVAAFSISLGLSY